MNETGPVTRNRYAVPVDDLEGASRVPQALQVESVDPDRGATMTSWGDWFDTTALAAGGPGDGRLGAGLAADGDGD
ncbi:MAG: hypothetical protein ACRDWY_09655 [Actinomycetes bacterium]